MIVVRIMIAVKTVLICATKMAMSIDETFLKMIIIKTIIRDNDKLKVTVANYNDNFVEHCYVNYI